MTTIEKQRSLMTKALNCLREIDQTNDLFGFDAEYKLMKIEALQIQYGGIMTELFKTALKAVIEWERKHISDR